MAFDVSGPWTGPALATSDRGAVEKLRIAVLLAGFLICLSSGMFFARRNLRLGRGDRRGATRLALTLIVVQMLGWAGVHHVWSLHEVALVFGGIAYALFGAAVAVVMYLALEPFARRRWPEMLISWTRLLSGDWRDSLVGRDILIGSATGVAGACLLNLVVLAPTVFGRPEPTLETFPLTPVFAAVGLLQSAVITGFLVALFLLFALFLLRIVLRNELAAGTTWVLFASMLALHGASCCGCPHRLRIPHFARSRIE